MEKEDTISVQWAQEDVETSYSLLNNNNKEHYFFLVVLRPDSGSWPPLRWLRYYILLDTRQSVGLLWTSDQPVADTSTSQHATPSTDEHPNTRR